MNIRFWWTTHPAQQRAPWPLYVCMILLAALSSGYSKMSAAAVTIALPIRINSAPVLIASSRGLFKKSGLDVVSQPFLLGRDALQSLLDGKAELALAAETPVMLALLGGRDISILAGIYHGRRTVAILTRNDRGINQLADLKGKSIGVTKGTNHAYFLAAMLSVSGIPGKAVRTMYSQPEAIIGNFKDGKLDAAVVFEPFLAVVEAQMGASVRKFYGEDIYAFRYLLVGRTSYVEANPNEVRRFLGAVAQANRMIRDEPLVTRRLVGEAIKENQAIMTKLWNPEEYVLSLDQALLLTLEDQSRWALEEGLVKSRPMPDFLQSIKYQHLEAVLPSAVKLRR
ncbi:MAG: ABC transporter substrate-binding protein [Burkholderiales bacterium]